MIEKVKAVSNPLTIVAIFAALAEVAGTVALATVNKELQQIFVWFVMGFPVLLVILFFATLNFNPRVLYAPRDFRDDANFLEALAGTRAVSRSLGDITRQLEEVKGQNLKQTLEEFARAGEAERSKLSETLNQQLEQIATQLKSVQQKADEVAATPSEKIGMPLSNLQSGILRFLDESAPEPVPLGEVYRKFARVDLTKVREALKRLVEYGVVVRSSSETGEDHYKSQD